MSRRALTLMVAGFLTLILGIVGAWLPVPYVVLSPGPTENTIGDVKGKPVITVSGRETFPTGGKLSLVTVAYQGGPGSRIDLFTALRGWLDASRAVVPEETLFPRSTTQREVEQQNTLEMTSSQELATAAALNELKVPIQDVITVRAVEPGKPADGKLKPGDQITAVDGAPVGDEEAIKTAVQKHKPGEQIAFTVLRGGKSTTVQTGSVAADDGQAQVGFVMLPQYKFPFKVNISVGDVGGPSAGLMFSLGIYDKLTPGPLTGGKSIAGTGTITADGEVGAIGGIQQKMVGAKDAGATIFLTPADNCAEASRAVPSGLRLVKVATMHDAITAIDAIKSGKGAVPSCTTG